MLTTVCRFFEAFGLRMLAMPISNKVMTGWIPVFLSMWLWSVHIVYLRAPIFPQSVKRVMPIIT